MDRTVLVLGSGPAGASAATFLAQRGVAVVIADRGARLGPDSPPKIGESLPPDAKLLLEQLGVWEHFQAGPHLRCYANKSYWGSDRVRYHDFLRHPVGHGWHLDRLVFEQMLIQRALDLGVSLQEKTSIAGADCEGGRWQLSLNHPDGSSSECRCDFIIDASGRSSWFARRQGVERLYEDQQLALVAFLKTAGNTGDGTTLVETVPQGWWYSAPIPGGRIATAMLCRPDKMQRLQWLEESGWWHLLSQAPHTRRRVHDGELISPPKFVAADSGILEHLYGQGWLAIGDAAMTHDPIASHGILMAMVSARDAARAIQNHLIGDQSSLANYEALMWAAYQQYVQQRQELLTFLSARPPRSAVSHDKS